MPVNPSQAPVPGNEAFEPVEKEKTRHQLRMKSFYGERFPTVPVVDLKAPPPPAVQHSDEELHELADAVERGEAEPQDLPVLAEFRERERLASRFDQLRAWMSHANPVRDVTEPEPEPEPEEEA